MSSIIKQDNTIIENFDDIHYDEKMCLKENILTQDQINELKKLGYLGYVMESITKPGFGNLSIDIYAFNNRKIVYKDDNYKYVYLLIKDDYIEKHGWKELESLINKYKNCEGCLSLAVCSLVDVDFIPIYLN